MHEVTKHPTRIAADSSYGYAGTQISMANRSKSYMELKRNGGLGAIPSENKNASAHRQGERNGISDPEREAEKGSPGQETFNKRDKHAAHRNAARKNSRR